MYKVSKTVPREELIKEIEDNESQDSTSVVNQELKGYMTAREFAEFIYDTLSNLKIGLTEDQLCDKINELLVDQVMGGLLNKGLMEINSIAEDGELCYKLTEKGKIVAKSVVEQKILD
jgi:hypothetical protein